MASELLKMQLTMAESSQVPVLLKLPLPKKLMIMPRPSKVRSISGSSLVEISFLGRESLGVKAFADALLIVPKTLATNSGHTAMDVVVTLAQETRLNGTPMGLDLETGEALIPEDSGIWDNYCVKESVNIGSFYQKVK